MATAKKSTSAVSEKAANFARIGSRRVANTLASLRSLRNLGNRASYEYTDAQVEKIMEAIEAEVKSLRDAFSKDGQAKSKGTFQL